MRRAVIALGRTVAGLAALFSYKTPRAGRRRVATPASPGRLTISRDPRRRGELARGQRVGESRHRPSPPPRNAAPKPSHSATAPVTSGGQHACGDALDRAKQRAEDKRAGG